MTLELAGSAATGCPWTRGRTQLRVLHGTAETAGAQANADLRGAGPQTCCRVDVLLVDDLDHKLLSLVDALVLASLPRRSWGALAETALSLSPRGAHSLADLCLCAVCAGRVGRRGCWQSAVRLSTRCLAVPVAGALPDCFHLPNISALSGRAANWETCALVQLSLD
jgi:hypothetical protein